MIGHLFLGEEYFAFGFAEGDRNVGSECRKLVSGVLGKAIHVGLYQ